MNNQYIEPKTRPTDRISMALRLVRPVVGAIIGLILFLLPTSPFLFSELGIISYGYYSSPLWLIDAVLIGPGLLTFFMFGSLLDSLGIIDPQNPYLFILGAASIPSMIIGFLVCSHQKYMRIAGIVILVFYILILSLGFPFWQMIWSA